MEHDSDLLNELQKQKSELIQELFTLQRKLKGITYMSYFADEYSYIPIICCSVAKLLFPTLCDPMDCSTLGPPILHHLLEFAKFLFIEPVMLSVCLILCCPLLLLPSVFPSIRVFSSESVHIRWPKYWSFIFSISYSSEDSGLISFRIDWFDLLAVQGAHKSLLYYRLILFFQNVFTHWDIGDIKREFYWCEKGIGKALSWLSVEFGYF